MRGSVEPPKVTCRNGGIRFAVAPGALPFSQTIQAKFTRAWVHRLVRSVPGATRANPERTKFSFDLIHISNIQ